MSIGLWVLGGSNLALTGVLAALTAPLAHAGIAVFALSTYDTDHVLVKARDLDRAIRALRDAGFEI